MDSKPIPPEPPKSLPPVPPAEFQADKPRAVPQGTGSDSAFLRRRLEKMEKDLSIAHQRAFAAEQIFKHQQAVKTEVESYLKTVTEQLKREKTERETQEQKLHAQGRIDALEKRLDEVHQSLLGVIKESFARAGAQKDANEQNSARIPEEFGRALLSLNAEVDKMSRDIASWRAETQKAIEKIPESLGRREDNASDALGKISLEINERIASWQRAAEIEAERQRERLEETARERAALSRAWEEQNHAVRQEHLQESLRQQAQIQKQISDMEQKILEVQKSNADALGKLELSADRISEAMSASPKARDEIIGGLETEKIKLLDALKERAQTLARLSEDRRASEENLAGKIMILHQKLDEERRAQDSLRTRLSDLETENTRLSISLTAAGKSLKDREELYAALAAQKDEVSKTLSAELVKGRDQAAKSRQIQQDAERRVEEVEKRLSQAAERSLGHELAMGQLRNQLAAMSEQLTRALKDKDEIQTRYASWEREREKIMGALREKDEMLSMLNSTFRNMMDRP